MVQGQGACRRLGVVRGSGWNIWVERDPGALSSNWGFQHQVPWGPREDVESGVCGEKEGSKASEPQRMGEAVTSNHGCEIPSNRMSVPSPHMPHPLVRYIVASVIFIDLS